MSEIAAWRESSGRRSFASGISVLDILDLPRALNKIMHELLRRREMSADEMQAAILALPDGERVSASEVDEALDALVDRCWLVRTHSDGQVGYRVNLRPKTPHTSPSGVWSVLDFDS